VFWEVLQYMAGGYTLQDVKERTYKPRDAWWTVLLVDPLAAPLVKVVANRTRITPNQLTFFAMVLGVGAAYSFWQATPTGLVVGALLFHLSFVVDCMDGKIARLKGTGSMFGQWLDFLFDRVRDLMCAVALFGGQFRETDNPAYLYGALAFIAVNMFRYLDASHIAKVRRRMNQDIVRACVERGLDPAKSVLGGSDMDDADDDGGDGSADTAAAPAAGTVAAERPTPGKKAATGQALNSGFLGPQYRAIRTALLRHRIRTHLFSGIELQMTTFVVAPVIAAFWSGSLLWVLGVAITLTLLFEAVLIQKLHSSTKAYSRVMARITAHPPLHPTG
jgi:phosphatidylglycerophosphate synthase